MVAHMTKALGGNQELMDAMIPKFPVGCRRLTPGVGYLESLGKENVRVVTQGIAKITEKGLELTSGEVVEVDAIICATGFDVSFCPRFPIIGRKGNLQDTWRNGIPSAYMSCTVPNVPNYFGKSSRWYLQCSSILRPKRTFIHLITLQYSWDRAPQLAMAVSSLFPNMWPNILSAC
jgi:cation diffusion facilitator CzcD-associated flavoprotein CzcO